MRLHPALPAPPTSPAPVSARRLALLLAAALSAPWAASSLLRAADTIPAPAGLDRRLDAGARTAPSGPPLAFPDREGGALVIWAAPEGLFAARVRPAPAPGGPEDPVLIPGSGSLLSGSLHAVEDGAGGAILTWLRDSTGPETSLEIVRVDANGGVVGRTALPVFGEAAGIPVADGLGGLLVVYRVAGEPALTLTRFDSSLQEAWSAGGFAPHEVRVAFVTTDRVGGAFALWLAQGANGAAPSLRGQYFDEFGWTAWPEAGVEVATAGAGPADARNVSAVADHDGGLFVAWTGAAGFMVRHLDRDGIVQTPRSAGAYGGFAEGQATAGDAPPAGFLIAATDTRDLLYSMLVPRNDSGFELVAGRLSAGPSESASPPPLAAPLELAAPLQLAARLPGGSRLAALVPDGSGGGSVFWISPRESGRELLTRRWLPSGELIGPDGGQVIAASLPGSSGAPDRGFALALDDRARGVLAWAPAASGAFARPFVAPSVAQIKDVDIGNFFFSPANVDIVAGDTVQWHFVNGSHTTTSGGCSGSSCPPSGIWGSAGARRNRVP